MGKSRVIVPSHNALKTTKCCLENISGGHCSLSKQASQMIKGVAILVMLLHHFIVIPFSELPHLVSVFGHACKICVAIYSVLSGYGYFFAKEKTLKYGLKKIWGLLQIYWISLFTLFIPIAIAKGYKLTPTKFIVQLFALLPNLNWFAWYVFFHIFCMLIMPFVHKCFKYKPIINFGIAICFPYILEVALHFVPNYESITIVHDLYSCMLYLPCFLVGFLIAKHNIFGSLNVKFNWIRNPIISLIGLALVFVLRIIVSSIFGLLLDVIYASLFVYFTSNIFEKIKNTKIINFTFSTLGKYSTSMWFFHAVFFSTYISDIFAPILLIVKWPPLMFGWLVILSLIGAIIYQKVIDYIKYIPKFFKRSM